MVADGANPADLPSARMPPTGFVISIRAVQNKRVRVFASTRPLSPHEGRLSRSSPYIFFADPSSAAGPDRRVPAPKEASLSDPIQGFAFDLMTVDLPIVNRTSSAGGMDR